MTRATLWEQTNTPFRLTARVRSHSSSVRSRIGVLLTTPALLTRISIRPVRETVSCTSRSTDWLCVTSATAPWAAKPASRNLLGRLLGPFGIEIDDDDRRAFARQSRRDRFADSAGRAGHQRGLALQWAHPQCRFPSCSPRSIPLECEGDIVRPFSLHRTSPRYSPAARRAGGSGRPRRRIRRREQGL